MSWAKTEAVKLREKHQQHKTLQLERKSFWWQVYFLEIISRVFQYISFFSLSPMYPGAHTYAHTEARARSVSFVL